jgi:hypothetical protein
MPRTIVGRVSICVCSSSLGSGRSDEESLRDVSWFVRREKDGNRNKQNRRNPKAVREKKIK